MAQQPHVQSVPDPEKKAKRKRSPSVAKPAFFVIQVLDDSGQPMPFDKKRIKLVKVERNAEAVLELVEGNEAPHAFYLRGIVPVTRTAQPRAAAQSTAPASQAA